MVELELPPGGRSRAHLHRGVETAGYMIEGELEMRWGDRLERTDRIAAGELVYIPTDDQQGIELLPPLDPA
jgi:uncharacterized RmlC-like cupin family protein